ncbi:hypothetical protein F0U62_49770 [Cystobacter fuscus]|uniref:hypothetical protein n=1 Tax=Cystobacter fuscus TaxID=43 RepID=UPI002B2A0EA1|nr:hypothetical protein F0U62_49770 [Cystobacter fuscus]
MGFDEKKGELLRRAGFGERLTERLLERDAGKRIEVSEELIQKTLQRLGQSSHVGPLPKKKSGGMSSMTVRWLILAGFVTCFVGGAAFQAYLNKMKQEREFQLASATQVKAKFMIDGGGQIDVHKEGKSITWAQVPKNTKRTVPLPQPTNM